MLRSLYIENIAVIEQANIDFTEGFNVMTGETGAGKSIIIDSLFAILGERTSRELIRHGCDKAKVCASFTDIGISALNKLDELGYTVDANDELVIQRILFADGRGQVKINSMPANVATLKELGKFLINIHGQHDNQTLLDPDKHMSFIDAYADNSSIKENYSLAFDDFRIITKELNAIIADEEEKKSREKLLKYQIDEIEKADILPGDVDSLKNKISIFRQSEKILEALNNASVLIKGTDDPENAAALELLKTALSAIGGISKILPDVKTVFESLNSAIMDLEGISADIDSLSENVDSDPNELQNAQYRLDTIYDLMLKYGNTEEAVLDYLEKSKLELEHIELDGRRKSELEGLIGSAETALINAGAALSNSRQKAAVSICKAICDELKFLDFNGAQFVADITSGKYTKNGCDYTEFMISANVGEVPKPLVKIASGGELSRIMLAIRSVLSLRDDVGTLIFDEIDTGISGHAAHKVAVKLYDVSKKRQVICVTHLAQIAAAADHHLFISKSVRDNKTYTQVTPLDKDGRVYEVARIMSGGEYTENLIKTAEELISLMKH